MAATSVKHTRWRHRLLAHHLPLCVLSVVCVAVLYVTRPYRDVVSRASFATAYPALLLLAATLLIGPWNLLRSRRNPLSGDLRRDIGLWAGGVGVLHSLIGQNVHLRGRPWLYYVYSSKEHHHIVPLRHDLFGFANFTGAAAFLVLILLFATSNDYSLRRLGTSGWKRLQRWNYGLFALAGAHTFAYQLSEKQHAPFVVTASLCVAVTVVVQLAGVAKRLAHARAQVQRLSGAAS